RRPWPAAPRPGPRAAHRCRAAGRAGQAGAHCGRRPAPAHRPPPSGPAPPPGPPPLAGPDAPPSADRRVASLAADGLSNRQIAQHLFITQPTVETHLRHAFHKLGITSRASLPRLVPRRVAPPELQGVAGESWLSLLGGLMTVGVGCRR